MLSALMQDLQDRMKKTIERLHQDFNKIRTGRAHPSLLDTIMVQNYGQATPLNQVASIVAEDARTLAIKPWDRALIAPIDKAIRQADLGFNPVTAGTVIRVPLPPLTEERRKSLSKTVRQEGEHGKVSLRNIRRDANQQLKDLNKSGGLTDDQLRQEETKIQKITDQFIKDIDQLAETKIAELMQI